MADSWIATSTGQLIRFLTNLGAQSNAGQQVVTLADSSGNLLGTTAAPFPTRDLQDAGRTRFAATVAAAAGVTSEGLLTLVPVRGTTAAGGATSLTVTAGKTLRISGIVFSLRSGAAAVQWARFTLRVNSTIVTTSSPSIVVAELGTVAASTGNAIQEAIDLPDGIEFSGTDQIGVSHISSATTNLESVTLIGFEY